MLGDQRLPCWSQKLLVFRLRYVRLSSNNCNPTHNVMKWYQHCVTTARRKAANNCALSAAGIRCICLQKVIMEQVARLQHLLRLPYKELSWKLCTHTACDTNSTANHRLILLHQMEHHTAVDVFKSLPGHRPPRTSTGSIDWPCTRVCMHDLNEGSGDTTGGRSHTETAAVMLFLSVRKQTIDPGAGIGRTR